MNVPIRTRSGSAPSRWSPRMPKPISDLTRETVDVVASIVMTRVVRTARSRGCCCFVFVRDGQVYVLSEELPLAHRWAMRRTEEWVGCYGGRPSLGDLAEDLGAMLRR